MSADILKFPARKVEPPVYSMPHDWQVYCTKCNGDTFRILQNGTVHCACGAVMRNLVAMVTP